MPTTATLVTPDRLLYDGEAAFVVMRSDGGEIMFLPEHAPFIGAVDICVLRIAPPGEQEGGGPPSQGETTGEFRAAVHGGFVHVADNHVTVLASVAEPSDEIDVERARRAFEDAEARVAAGEGAETKRQQEATEGEDVEQSPAMLAMLAPDEPEVRLRRAQVRLETAGVEQTSSH